MEDCFNREEEVRIDLGRLNYIAFQGGGGKGIAYLGPIDVLIDEGVLPIQLPIPPKHHIPGQNQGIIGISGTSAGAITAYLVALGLTSDDIRNESGFLDPRRNPDYEPANPDSEEFMLGENTRGFDFEQFLTKDTPENGYKRAVVYNENTGRNEITRAADKLGDNLTKLNGRKKNNQRVKDESFKQAITYGLSVGGSQNVHKSHTKAELKQERKRLVYPSQKVGTKEELKSTVDDLIKERKKQLRRAGYAAFWSGQRPAKKVDSRSAIEKTVFESKESRNDYIYNVMFDNGAFPGFSVNDYFCDVTSRRLPVSLGWNDAKRKAFDKEAASQMTFKEFFEYTGLDLIIAGLNVTNGNQRNFSKDCTPDFPVVAAVQMSMNIPILFKPVFVDAEINKSLNKKEQAKLRREFQGYWIDAGVVNNIPFHAFDEKVEQAGKRFLKDRVNQLILGLAVREGPDPALFEKYYLRKKPDPYFQTFREKKDGKFLYKDYTNWIMNHPTDPDYPSENFVHLRGDLEARFTNIAKERAYTYNGISPITSSFLGITLFAELGWLLNTVLLNSTEKQIVEKGAKARVIDVYAYHIGITDFRAEENLTEFVVRRATERTRNVLGLEEKDE